MLTIVGSSIRRAPERVMGTVAHAADIATSLIRQKRRLCHKFMSLEETLCPVFPGSCQRDLEASANPASAKDLPTGICITI